jgi:hypothetical protein
MERVLTVCSLVEIGFMPIVVSSTIHQCLIQWHANNVELVHADDSVSIAMVSPMFWELDDFECFSGKLWEGGFIRISSEGQQLTEAIGSESLF